MIFKSLTIIDYINKCSNKFEFSDKANLIISSGNGDGKSSLVKSIYFTLGFENKKKYANRLEHR